MLKVRFTSFFPSSEIRFYRANFIVQEICPLDDMCLILISLGKQKRPSTTLHFNFNLTYLTLLFAARVFRENQRRAYIEFSTSDIL